MEINIYTAWVSMLLGGIAGAIQGIFFSKEEWLGGYSSWTRRLMRLGHISLFGIAFINISFAATVYILEIESDVYIPSLLLVIGAIGMPTICYLSAFIKSFRHLFFIPVLSIVISIIDLLWIVFSR